MDVRAVVMESLEGTPLEVIAFFRLGGEVPLMPRARAVVAVGVRHEGGVASTCSTHVVRELLLRVDVALARARIGSRRVDAQAELLPRIFDPLGVWLVDLDDQITEGPLLKTA